MADAGWYPDPQDPSSVRYFDGTQWTEHLQSATPQAAPPPVRQPAQPTLPAQPVQPATSQYPGGAFDSTQYPVTNNPTSQYPASPPVPAASDYPTAQYGGYAHTTQLPAYSATPPPSGKRNRVLLIVGVVAVLLVAGGAIWYFLRPDKPTLTYQGKSIKNASQVLDDAQTNLDAVVKQRHGVTNGDTRCYYAVPNTAASGAKKSDVDNRVRCGPVLFVDGDADAPYLPFTLTSTPSGSSVQLSVSTQPASDNPIPVGAFDLKRPDGKTPPSGSGGLTPPAPPPAASGTIVATDIGPVNPPATAPATASMGSYNAGVRLIRAGLVARYGSGDDARSAPSGSQIVAFQLTAIPGDIADHSDQLFSYLKLIAGSQQLAVPEPDAASQFIAAVIPSGSNPVLQLTDGGYVQTLSLPGGQPGASNLTVLTRAHRKGTDSKTFSTTFQLVQGTATGAESVSGKYTGTQLDFWNPDEPKAHPASTSNGLLRVLLNYQNTAKPGVNYGFDPQLLSLKLPNGTVLPAKNIAGTNFVIDVFEVPATFTTGTIMISGTHVVDGVNVTVSPSISLPVNIAAG